MRRPFLTAIGTTMLVAVCAAPAAAQLDPLLFVKRVPPNVIILVDTSMRMLEDGNGYYYDPREYQTSQDTNAATVLGVNGAAKYRRKYKELVYTSTQDTNSRFAALNIIATPNTDPNYSTFYSTTRIEIAKAGIYQTVSENLNVRWGLIKTRQKTPSWRAENDCDKPVNLTNGENSALFQPGAKDTNPCSLTYDGRYGIFPPKVADANYNQTTAPTGTVIATPGVDAPSTIMNKTSAALYDNNGLIPAGQGTATYHDRPITYMLEDAYSMLTNSSTGVFGKDSASMVVCRNTVVVLVTGGSNDGPSSYLAGHPSDTAATKFKSVTAGSVTNRLVPIYVVAIKPASADETDLQTIAANSGGQYYNVTTSSDVTRVINLAVQAGFSRSADFQAGKTSEFTAVSPIIGTVNLKDARDITGGTLPLTEINLHNDASQAVVPQRSNMLVTAGFSLPGFDGRIRAFRTYVPAVDTSQPSGWKFTKDGTRLWPDLDGRSYLAGLARTPVDPNARNIYTYIPTDAGGGSMVKFSTDNAATLMAALNVTTTDAASTIINYVRARALGAVIGSTPALMDPPSLDPPPDEDYGHPDHSATTFAGKHTDRRSIIFVGANDGMMHAIDARTGYEIWAFIPYNLLPKLRTLLDGQPVEQFDYFVDSSPKIAEVKMNTSLGTHEWRSLLIFGEGPGGTFYQAFDITEAGMGVNPTMDDLGAVNSLLAYFDMPDETIKFLWAFPKYSSFNPSVTYTISGLTDATPGGRMKVYGDVKASASYAEKTVGFTWSDPAVGPLDGDRNVNAVMVGSGYFPDIESVLIPGRGNTAPKAGHVFYLIQVDNGTLLGNASGVACSGAGCIDVGDVSGSSMKNALQADPSAAGDNGVPIVKKAYVGDLDGKYWRFDFGPSGALTKTVMLDPAAKDAQPIFSSSALLFVGSADVYMFFSTGSDLLPAASAQGTGAFKLYALKDNYPAAGATVKFTKSLLAVTNTGGIAGGERPSTAPSVAGDIVFYTTSTQDAAAACSDFVSNLYAFTYLGGAAYDSATDADAKLSNNENPLVQSVTGRATAPFIVDQHLYFGTAGAEGVKVEAFGDPDDFNNGVGQIGVRILSWREIR
jgi:hypothetical protein